MSAISDAKPVIDAIAAIAKRVQSRELDEEIHKLYGIFHAAHEEALKEKEHRLELQEQLQKLKTERARSKKLVLRDAMLWEMNDEGKPITNYCAACHALKEAHVPLIVNSPQGLYVCPNCKSFFPTAAYTAEMSRPVPREEQERSSWIRPYDPYR